MKTIIFSIFFATVMSLGAPALARTSVPIVNYEKIIVATNTGNALQAEQVKQAIQAAAGSKGWSIAHQADGKLLASLTVHGKHTIIVEIDCTAESYSLRYKDSVNMNYSPAGKHSYNRNSTSQSNNDDVPVIHPHYNRWTQELRDAIRIELLKR
jgi:hypothetical protein